MTVHELIQTVTKFHGELNLLLSELPKDLEIGSLGRSSHSPKQVNECLYLHFSIHSSIMAAHCHLFYPWLVSRFSGIGSDATVKDQIASSSNIIAEAARKIILALRLVNPSVATPSCLAFYYPLHAMINLFIHLVKSPALSTAATDLGLLDACVGHFGYVEFFTASAVSITLPREVANVASRAVQVARTKNTDSTAVERVTDNTQQNESEAQSAGTEVFNFNFDDFQTEPILQNEVCTPYWIAVFSFLDNVGPTADSEPTSLPIFFNSILQAGIFSRHSTCYAQTHPAMKIDKEQQAVRTLQFSSTLSAMPMLMKGIRGDR